MANNAPKLAAKECREPTAAVVKKAEALVAQIKKSKHFIAFTVAGVSTSAGKLPAQVQLPQSIIMTPSCRNSRFSRL